MSPEWVTAIATFFTALVIAASAVAALVQLRHMPNSNQLAVFSDFRHEMESEPLNSAYRFVLFELSARVNDPRFRRETLSSDPPNRRMIVALANFFDSTGLIVRHDMVDRDLACDLLYGYIVRCWDALAPLTASMRARLGYRVWEDFEYLALMCKRFRKRFPQGTYPAGEEALALPQAWPEVLEPEAT